MSRPTCIEALRAAREADHRAIDLRYDALELLAGEHDASPYYSARNLPPRTTRRAFVETCRSGRVAGAVMIGRVWECTASAWHAARKTRTASATPKPHASGARLVPSVDSYLRSIGRAS